MSQSEQLVTINVHYMDKKINLLSFMFHRKKQSHTGLEGHEGE